MSLSSDLRNELQSLSIPKNQRPTGRAAPVRAAFPLGRIVVLLALGAGGYYAYQNRAWLAPAMQNVAESVGSKAPQIETLTVRAQSEQSSPAVLTATGKIVSDHRVQVVTKVSGQIVELKFEQGDRVEKGQVLARIEDVNYRARRDEAAAMVEKSRATLEFQRYEHQRMNDLSKGARASEREIVSARSAVEQAEAQLSADKASLVWAEKALQDTEVVAPIAGVILERNVEVGDFVAAEGGRGANANAQFASIADMSKLRVEIDISELDVARVRTGMPCTIVPDAYKDRKYYGHVLWIDPGANYAKATVQAKVRIENPDEYLRVEGSAQVQFLTEDPRSAAKADARPVIWVASSAVKLNADGSGGTVFAIVDGRLKQTPVVLGRKQGGQFEVLEGLKDGDVIVAKDLDKLSDGQRAK
jgi:RND family efflux transporter MFP subunit